MGQCVSTKAAAAGAFDIRPMSRPLAHNITKIPDDVKETSRRQAPYTKGVACSFGFRKRPETAIPILTDNASIQKKQQQQTGTDLLDKNGNDDLVESFESSGSSLPSGRSTPRLPAPKKEAVATTRASRFGFRHATNTTRAASATTTGITGAASKFKNNNNNNNNVVEKPRAKGGGKTVTIAPIAAKSKNTTGAADRNTRNALVKSTSIPQPNVPTKYTLHSTQLPRPQLPVRVMESKTAKTAANINRKVSTSQRSDEGSSSVEGSITGDSGVGSQTSGTNGNGETDTLHGIELLDASPHFPVRHPSRRVRNLEMIVSGNNFDVRDLDDFTEDGVVTEVAVIPLPRLPSVFSNNFSTGTVRDRTREYQRRLDKHHSEDSDFGEEEKSFRDISSNEKTNRRDYSFRSLSKPRCLTTDSNRSLETLSAGKDTVPSSPVADGHEWAQAGEAMLDVASFSNFIEKPSSNRTSAVNSPVMDTNLLSESYTGTVPKTAPKSVLLTIEDPFAAAAAATSSTLLDDETSPQDSLISSFTESEDVLGNSVKKAKNSVATNSKSSGSKDVNDKSPLSPTSPGTPTNTSLSLSEGRDFLIDDEIADQPALMFNQTVQTKLNDSDDHVMRSSDHPNLNDSIATLVETPKRLRKCLGSCAASIDTLSPCESIASDDLMLDFEHSQSSGIDDSTDRLNDSSGLHSLDEATLRTELETKHINVTREWSSLLGTHSNRPDLPNSVSTRTNNFLRSRSNTPSSIPDSPRLLNRTRALTAHSPLTAPSPLTAHSPLLRNVRTTNGSPVNYDSDDTTTHDLLEIKSLVLKLQNVLQENEPHNPFDKQAVLKNGLCNGLSQMGEHSSADEMDCGSDAGGPSMQIADLQKQVLFLQTQLEDKERVVQQLQARMAMYSLSAQLNSRSGRDPETCNAATQTDRVRPISAGPSLLQSLPAEGNLGPLVSVNECTRRSRPHSMVEVQQLMTVTSTRSSPPPLKLWRKPGEPPPPARFIAPMSMHQRSNSRTRATLTPS